MQIVRGAYQPLPDVYSEELRNLVDCLLQSNPDDRPTVNSILQMDMIASRIQLFLTWEDMQEEFKHTVLHHQNVFEKAK